MNWRYTGMMLTVCNIEGKQHWTNLELYTNISKDTKETEEMRYFMSIAVDTTMK